MIAFLIFYMHVYPGEEGDSLSPEFSPCDENSSHGLIIRHQVVDY